MLAACSTLVLGRTVGWNWRGGSGWRRAPGGAAAVAAAGRGLERGGDTLTATATPAWLPGPPSMSASPASLERRSSIELAMAGRE